jgi:hypothetical protein
MNIIIDLDLQQAVQGFGSRQAALPYQVKSQDTPTVAIYFVRGNVTYDLGASPGLRFGVFVAGNPNPLVQQNAFTKTTDNLARTVYVAYPNFNTTAMLAAIGSQPQLSAIGEIRYQTSYGTIARTADVDFTVVRSLLTETVMDNLIAAFVTPAVNANVTARINNTGWLSAGLNISISGGAGAYQVVSVTNVTDFVAKNLGGASNAASGTTIPIGTAVGIAPVNVLQAYPDPSIIEVTTHKDQINGYAGLNASKLLAATEVPIDGTTIAISGGKLTVVGGGGGTAGQNAYTTTSTSFVVPAVGATVPVAVASTAWMGGTGYVVFITGAGYYAVSSITDATHVVLTNMGGASNAIAGTTVPSGATVSAAGPVGAAGAAGTPGAALSAYDALASSFVMPAASANVTITIANTAWMGVGQVIYIASAGYFQVASISSATQASVTNLNYPGNASAGGTIALGSKVSAGGLIGATGSGGAGKNAFTNLAANFAQPAVNSTVSINVGTTAWMAVGQVIFVQGGGYYSVNSITDLTDAVVTNLGYAGNAAPGATVTSGSTIAVTPGGLVGQAGADAFTTTTASFIQPAVSGTVTVSVGNTSWMAQGQNLYIPSAGYYSVSVVIDSTHVVLSNLGVSGSASAGTAIAGASKVSPAGAQGQQGNQGVQGAPGSLSNASDAIGGAVSPEVSLIQVISAGTLSLKKLKAGSNVTLTDQGGSTGDVLIAASSGGGGAGLGYWDPSNGLYFQDDFCYVGQPGDNRYSFSPGTGATISFNSVYGQNSTLKVLGAAELGTGTSASNTGAGFAWGGNTTGPNYPIVYGLGAALTFKTRVILESALPATGGVYALRTGIGQTIGVLNFNAPNNGFFFEYSPDSNSGQWRVGVGAAITYTNTSIAVAADTAYDLEIDVNAAWTSINFLINGTVVATVTTGIPTTSGWPLWQYAKGSGGTVNRLAAIDSWMIYYPVAR